MHVRALVLHSINDLSNRSQQAFYFTRPMIHHIGSKCRESPLHGPIYFIDHFAYLEPTLLQCIDQQLCLYLYGPL